MRGSGAAVVAWCILALAGCPTVDLGDTPPDIGLCTPAGGMDYFTNTLWPQYLHPSGAKDCAQSAGCHAMAHGLALSTTAPIDFTANYRVTQQYLNCGTPEASELLTKPLAGVDGHGGGDLFPSTSDPGAQVFLDWFK
jgi:hypothetical protein